jgi:hypothetical protein
MPMSSSFEEDAPSTRPQRVICMARFERERRWRRTAIFAAIARLDVRSGLGPTDALEAPCVPGKIIPFRTVLRPLRPDSGC